MTRKQLSAVLSHPLSWIVDILLFLIVLAIDHLTEYRFSLRWLAAPFLVHLTWLYGGRTGSIAWLGLAVPLVVEFKTTQALASLGQCVLLGSVVLVTTCWRKAQIRLEQVERTDSQTGLLNRLGFLEVIALERNRHSRLDAPVSLLYLDCDTFKKVNDQFGHAAGDRTLGLIANALRDCTRSYDSIARLGGDEFGILLPHTDEEGGKIVASRCQEALAVRLPAEHQFVTFSIGLVTFEAIPETPAEMLKLADEQMYQVKQSARDGIASRTVSASG